MRTRKTMRKLLSLALALVMLLALLPIEARAADYKKRVLKVDLQKIVDDGKTWDGPCGGFALAYCMTIFDGKTHKYSEYYNETDGAKWANGGYTWDYNNPIRDKSTAYKKLFSEINSGKPVIARVNSLSSESKQHYVTVVGYENVSSENDLTNKNFLIIDPNTPSSGIRNMSSVGYDLKAVNGAYQVVYDSKGRASVGFQTEELQCDHRYQTIKKSDGSYVARCSKCSYEYPIQVSSNGVGKYQVTEASTLCSYPYQDAKTSTKVSVGDILTVTGSAVNAYINTWYRLSSGLWIYSGHVAFKEALPSYYLNVNGILDGTLKDGTSGYGTFDVYINGSLVANDVNDYYKQWPEGTRYEVKDIKTKSGHSYNGVQGNLSGTITKYIEVNLKFDTTASSLTVSQYIDCNYAIKLPERVVSLYKNVTDTSQYDYYSYGPTVYVYQYAVMSDGSFRYKVVVPYGSNKVDLWFVGASDMVITDNSYYSLRVDGALDGQWSDSITGWGTFDVYINGSLVADDVSDYYDTWKAGTTYQISGIYMKNGYTYSGVSNGTLSGTINDDTEVALSFNTDQVFTYTVDSKGNATITGYTGSSTSLSIPSSIDGYPVKAIGDQAFFCCSLYSVTIPNSVHSIGEEAFYGCGVQSVIIPNSVTSIGSDAFACCYLLTNITIPSSVTTIENGAFCGCPRLMNIYAENGNANFCDVDGVLFNKDKTKLIAYPSGRAGGYVVPSCVTSIGSGAFSGCSGLTSATLPNSVSSIGSSAFSDCSSLTSITIPNGVTYLDTYTFFYCNNLTSISLPVTLNRIANYVFYNTALRDVYYSGTQSDWSKVTVGKNNDCLANATIHCAADPITINSITANKTSVKVDEPITWTASASGGSGTLQYSFCVYKDGNLVAQSSYGTGKTYTYTPTTAGSYTLRVYVKDSESISINALNKETVWASAPSSTMILVGDVNGDGQVTNADAAFLKRYVAGWSVGIVPNAADLNRDGSVTNADAALLNRYISGWAGYDSYIIEVPASP